MVSKLERQMSLLATLLHAELHLTAADIQRRVEGYSQDITAFRRAFERDKEDLRRLGVPIDLAVVDVLGDPVQGYRVNPDEYYLHDLGLNDDESVALAMALRVIRLEGDTAGDDVRWKLGGARPNQSLDADELGRIAIGPGLMPVHEAVRNRVTVRFEFRGAQRTVEPWRISHRNGQWYLQGYDVDRRAPRRFRLDRVEGAIAVLDDRPATEPRGDADDERQPWQFGSDLDDAITARVLVAASHAEWTRRALRDASVVANHDDGSIEIELLVTDRSGFRTLVLGMFDAAVVLAPPELRAEIVDWLQAQVA